jgi:hypothetical protein
MEEDNRPALRLPDGLFFGTKKHEMALCGSTRLLLMPPPAVVPKNPAFNRS